MNQKLLFPDALQFAVIRIDPLAMVEPLKDPVALEAARSMQCKKYLVFLEAPRDLPMPKSKECRYSVKPVATCLRPADVENGVTPDMVMPIHPNTEHLRGRDPIKASPKFPYDNCFFWIENKMSVCVKVNPAGYDGGKAITVGAREHLAVSRCWSNDFERMESYLEYAEAGHSASPPSAILRGLPSPIITPSYYIPPPGHQFQDDDDDDDDETDVHLGNTQYDGDDHLSLTAASDHLAELKQLFALNPFGWDRDPKEMFLPLVDLWLDLEEHLSAAEIPSPVDFYEEQAAIALLVVLGFLICSV
ncbi:hypothetical protein K466DRAFT_489729 [Polyporus arcularius HHB13444]|uniref:Uncharacterized protein n=1 Tax=Polyporus arcularius HHB13444 TaxID=1314778 RepID=A0A5C3PIJ6_9APHY|nr:hypothetical protein K466DRAFT_489729 [Polyporus arcularius HHB13444]